MTEEGDRVREARHRIGLLIAFRGNVRQDGITLVFMAYLGLVALIPDRFESMKMTLGIFGAFIWLVATTVTLVRTLRAIRRERKALASPQPSEE